jgi:plastocyanin domain-containing protein
MIARPLLVVAALAFALTGCKKAPPAEAAPACPTCVRATDHGFVPSHVTLAKGAAGSKATLTFTRETEDTCALDVVFPELDVKKPLPLNVPVTVEVPTDEARTLTFQCGMAMYKSSVVVQ